MESDAWSFRADRCSTPAVFARGGGLVTTERSSPLGQSGVGFAYRDGRPTIWLDFPYREEPLRYDGSRDAGAARRPDVPLAAGRARRRSTFRATTATGAASSPPRLAAVRRPAAWVSVEEAAALAAHGPPPLALPARPAAAASRRPPSTATRSARRRPRQHARLVGERRAVRVRAAPARAPRRQRRVRRGGRGGARPRRREPDARRDVLAAVDARPRLDVGLAPRPRRARTRARSPTRRSSCCAPAARWQDAARSNLDVALPHPARRRRAPGGASRRDRRRRLVGGHGRHGVDPGARRGRPRRRGAPRRRVLQAASTPGTARRRTSTSRRPPRTATPP